MEKFERDTMVSAKERNEAITKAMQELRDLKELVVKKSHLIDKYGNVPEDVHSFLYEMKLASGCAKMMMGQFQETAYKYHAVGQTLKDEIYSIRLAIDKISFHTEETTKTINKQINRIGIILSGIAFLGGMMFIVWLVQYLLQFIR